MWESIEVGEVAFENYRIVAPDGSVNFDGSGASEKYLRRPIGNNVYCTNAL